MRVISLIGPTHSGKTTLATALAHLEPEPPPRVPFGDALAVQPFRYLGEDWAVLDLQGGPEALAAAGAALAASDAVVVCVPPEPESAVLAAPYLRLAEAAGLPVVIFMNRIDTLTERLRDVVAALQGYLGHTIVLRQIPIRQGGQVVGAVDLISERAWEYHEGRPSSLMPLPDAVKGREAEARTALLETLADHDDALMEELIEDHAPMTAEVYGVAARALAGRELVACFFGSASHGNGLVRLMKSLRHEVPQVAGLAARLPAGVLAAAPGGEVRRHLGKIVLVRAMAALPSGAMLAGAPVRLTALDARTAVAALAPGALGLALKADHLRPGRLFTAGDTLALPGWAAPRPPAQRAILTPATEKDDARLSAALAQLAEVDSGLTIEPDEASGRLILGTQGPVHARRVAERLATDFGLKAAEGPVPPAYRETVARMVEWHYRHKKQTGGAGQFADIVIEVQPRPRGQGVQFVEQVKGGAVPRNYIPAVEAGVHEGLREGPRGFPVVDIAVVLKDGKHHAVDSSDHAFRTAGRMGLREALAEAGTRVLQPILRADISVPSAFSGALVPALSALKGQDLAFVADPEAAGWDRFTARLPAAMVEDLARTLAGATRGTAWFTTTLDRYEEAPQGEMRLAAAG